MEKYFIKINSSGELNDSEDSLDLVKVMEGEGNIRIATIYNYGEFEKYIDLRTNK